MLGEKIKLIRLKKGYTLADVSEKVGYTTSFLSQIERNLKRPSLKALRKISECLDFPLVSLFVGEENFSPSSKGTSRIEGNCCVIVKEKREKIIMPEIYTEYEFITPVISDEDKKPKVTGFFIRIKPHTWVSEKMIMHNMEESTFIISGFMEAHVGDEVYSLSSGDSIFIRENSPHNFYNCGDETLICTTYFSSSIY